MNATETLVLQMWADLGLPAASVDDDFFELGGQSLTLVAFLARVQDTLGVEVPVDALFEADLTAAAAARVIDEALLDGVGPEELAAAMAELDGMSEAEIAALLAQAE